MKRNINLQDIVDEWNKNKRDMPKKMDMSEIIQHLDSQQTMIMKAIFLTNGIPIIEDKD